MAELTFVGTGEAFDPDLPNTSLLYRGALTLLIDCGYSIPHAFWKICRDPSLLDAIYISHIHADHSFGLPALLAWMKEEGRTRPLELIGGIGVGKWLERLFDLAYPGSFPDAYPIVPVELSPGESLERGGATLRNAQSDHKVRNLSLRIDEASKSFCYSGDGRPSQATRELFTGATLLVHECYRATGETEGHARAVELFELAETAGVRTLALLHLSRSEKAAIEKLAGKARPNLEMLLPKPGDHRQL